MSKRWLRRYRRRILLGVKDIQSVLDAYCLAEVHINPESRVKVAEGLAAKELMQQGGERFW